ncbi:MAG TPA: ABC transporter substrate-binding protein, partial [Gemmatimonadales bacterium]|nr:ABC transporter substrate-binding protein [Gemmatimonadales bacterium]
ARPRAPATFPMAPCRTPFRPHASRPRRAGGRSAALLVALVAASACRGSFPSQPADSPTVRVGNPVPISSFEPRRAFLSENTRFANLVYEGLTMVDAEGRTVPALADRWTVSPDGRVYRFHLRPGAVFHDGTPVTAADVERSWLAALRTSAAEAPYMLDPIEGADEVAAGRAERLRGLTVVGDSLVELRIERPLALLPTLLSLPQAAIVARANGPARPVGTGPWRWVRGQPRTGEEIWLARHEGYWGPRPQLDSVVIRTVPDSLQLEAFERRWIDFTNLVAAEARTQLSSESRVGFMEAPSTGIFRLTINTADPRFRDPRVRRAFSHAIDVAKLARTFPASSGAIAAGALPPGFAGADPARKAYAYDPALARRLLEEAHFPFRWPVRFWAPAANQGEFPPELAPLIRDYLEAVGLKVELHQDSTAWDMMAANRADLVLESWYADYADADAFLYPLFHSRTAGAAGNSGRYADRETDRWIDSSRASQDSARRAEFLRRADRRVFDQAANVFLWFTKMPTAYSLRLDGWTPTSYTARYQELRLADDRP